MQTIRIAIVEDELPQAETLRSYLERYKKEHPEYEFSIVHFSSSINFAETYKSNYDVLFLDIQMPGMTGMELAHELRKSDPSVMIIFVTSLAQFAIEGYEVQATDYMLKPVTYAEFQLKMARAFARLLAATDKAIVFNTKDGFCRVPLTDIIYTETDSHSIVYHTISGDYRKHQSMKEAEKDLPEAQFLRINSCYVVALNQIVGAEQRFAILKNGERLLISRPRMSHVMAIIKGKTKE